MSDLPDEGSVAPSLEPSAVASEIEEEARRIRTSGALPSGYEKELAETFDKLVPKTGSDLELLRALQTLGERSFIRGVIPIQEEGRMQTSFKRLIRKTLAWYMNFLAEQTGGLGEAAFAMDQLLVSRIEELQDRIPPPLPKELFQDLLAGEPRDLAPWCEHVVEVFRGVPGRVLHLEAGRGELLEALVKAGVDAYGVEPRGSAFDDALSRGLDVWQDEPLTHLGRVGPRGLSGLILSGVVDRLAPGSIWELIVEASTRLKAGARVVVIAPTPFPGADGLSASVPELSPGKALRPSTWEALLSGAGFEEVTSSPGRVTGSLVEDPDASDAMKANIGLLNGILFGPGTVAISGVAPS